MQIIKKQCKLYGITPEETKGTYLTEIEEAIKGGITMLQLRKKNLSREVYIAMAREVLGITAKYHIPLIINDDPEVALLSGAEGVHVGQEDMGIEKARQILGPDRIIGATAHNLEEALRAYEQGADYLGVGAAFGSTSKKDAKPIDRSTYQSICESVPIPVVAIGGITADNIRELSGRGLSGVAVIGAVFGAENIQEGARILRAEVERL